MKRVYNIIIMLLLLFVFVGCSKKYTTVYCDFDMGTFDSKGYYQIKSVSEINTFKEKHQTSASFNDKMKYDDKFFNNMYLIVLVMPQEESNVKYEIQHINYKNSELTVHVKQIGKSTDSNNNNESNGNSNNNDNSNNGNLPDTNPTLDGNDNLPGNNDSDGILQNDGTGNGMLNDNNGNDENNDGTNNNPSNGNQDGTNNNPSTNPGDTKMKIHKGFILEFNKKHTVTKINLNII